MRDGIHPGYLGPGARKAPILIWTRAAADLPVDKYLLNALRVDVLHVPCIGIETLTPPQRSEGSFQKKSRIIFTSQNAVKICAAWRELDPAAFTTLASATSIFTHGRKTAELAEKLLDRPIQCIDSPTSEGLAAALLRDSSMSSTPMVWFCGEDVAFDLSSHLKSNGLDCERIPVYRTGAHPTDSTGQCLVDEALAAAREQLALRVKGCRIAICFASPSAVSGWLKFAGSHALLVPKAISAAVIGPTTARAATEAGFARVTACAWPQLADLAALGTQLAF